MGSITTGVGLISGIDTAALIDSLITLESQPVFRLQSQIDQLQAQQTAMLDINARLLNLKNAAHTFFLNKVFRSTLASSSKEEILSATTSTNAQPGKYNFTVAQRVSTSQVMTRGFANSDSSPLGLTSLSFEFGQGRLYHDQDLNEVNGGDGISRGEIIITDSNSDTATIDLSDVTSINEVIARINESNDVDVTASVEGDHLVITDNGGGTITVANGSGDTTATDLGIKGTSVTGQIIGTDINRIGLNTSLSSFNDGNGVLIRDGVTDFKINDGSSDINIDLGRIDTPITAATALEDLNNGSGVSLDSDSDNPELTFVDRDGTSYEVDLTGITTVGELQSRVTAATSGNFALNIAGTGDRFEVAYLGSSTDQNMQVKGAGTGGTDTAEDLGILNITGVAANSFEGEFLANADHDPRVETVGDLIDRVNSQLIEAASDVRARVTASGTSIELYDSVASATITVKAGSPDGSPDGAAVGRATLEGLGFTEDQSGVQRVSGSRRIAALNSVLIENLNGGSGLSNSVSTTLAGSTLLSDLFSGSGLSSNLNGSSPDIRIQDRTGATYDIEVDDLTTVQDLIDEVATQTGGLVTLSINGQALQATNTSVGALNFQIQDLNGSGTASQLGIVADNTIVDGDTVVGTDTSPTSLTPATEITFTDRAGNTMTVGNLDTYTSLSEIIDAINQQAIDDTVNISVDFNDSGNGLSVTDTVGGPNNLIVSGDAATSLGIETDPAGVESNSVEGTNLQLKYVSLGKSLRDLNYGRGVGTGTFKLKDGLGNTANVTIGTDAQTLYDVMNEINSRGLAISARINDNGDGLILEELTSALGGVPPFVPIEVQALNGSVAKDLNLIGVAESIDGGPAGGASIDGSYERTVELSATDNLNDVVASINSAGIPVSASVINTGSGSKPFRISFASEISGSIGDLIIDTGGVDLGLKVIEEGKDAKVFFGSQDPADAFLITSSTNTLDDVIQGVTINLNSVSEDVVTLTIERDKAGIIAKVQEFAAAFNDAIGRIDDYDFFDVENETRGPLLGDPRTGTIFATLIRTVLGKAENLDTQYQRLRDVGLTIGEKSTLNLDLDKFEDALATDFEAVEALFSAFEATTGATEEISPGVTIQGADQVFTKRGIGEVFDGLLARMTNSTNGTLKLADDTFNTRISLAEDRIESLNQRLDARRLQLQLQFAAMESALASLQSQGAALGSIAGNISLAQSLGQRR